MTRTSRKPYEPPIGPRSLLVAGLVTLSSVATGSETLDIGADIEFSVSQSTELERELSYENPAAEPSSGSAYVVADATSSSETLSADEGEVVTTSVDPSIMNELQEYRHLQKGWDGFGAPAIPDEVIDIAERTALRPEVASREPSVFPTGRETVQFEFANARGDEAELEIFSDDEAYLLLDPSDDEMYERKASLDKSISLLDEFLT